MSGEKHYGVNSSFSVMLKVVLSFPIEYFPKKYVLRNKYTYISYYVLCEYEVQMDMQFFYFELKSTFKTSTGTVTYYNDTCTCSHSYNESKVF